MNCRNWELDGPVTYQTSIKPKFRSQKLRNEKLADIIGIRPGLLDNIGFNTTMNSVQLHKPESSIAGFGSGLKSTAEKARIRFVEVFRSWQKIVYES